MNGELPTTFRFTCPACGYDHTWRGYYDASCQSIHVKHTHIGTPPYVHPYFTDAWIEDRA